MSEAHEAPWCAGRGDVYSSRGFTLVEAAIVIVVIGLLGVLAFPRMSAAMSRSDLRSARTTVVNLVAAARAASVASNRVTSLQVAGGNAYVTATPRWSAGPGAVDTVGPVKNLTALYKVSVANMPAVQFDPRGFGTGFAAAADSIVLVRGSYREVIWIDGLGRVRK